MAKRLTTFFIDHHLAQGLKDLKKRTGVARSEHIRKAIEAYLKAQGVFREPKERKVTRKKRRS